MNLEGTHIRFVPVKSDDRKTKVWNVCSKYDGAPVLGYIGWFGRWRKYSFFPAIETVFEEVCMREISDFIQNQSKEYMAAKRKSGPGGGR